MAEALYYKEENQRLYLKGEGHITAILCADLRELIFNRFEQGHPLEAFYIDLSACDYMDSTFMGLLVGFNKRMLKLMKKRITIVCPSSTAKGLMEGLGLTSLVDILEDPVPFPKDMININQTKTANVDLLLHSHENLMELSEENKKKFAALHSVLKNQKEQEP
ncbi:STAS domain-containing protein [Gracilinema caldarium]|uniref:Anti-sigma-factor antagonist n=1 Tax=Gracilinema caldarium (strain ATCC 51460 / DSM 7334 / H1) TaxID=744872 RepID=F8F2V1_GRAC1|nr:STAS domain-containing protein [Gracilinema caldarium]AEJ19495.1 anti-sigma-factor antagonist [Gracilinema caldarium DSM 7334]